MIKCFKAYNHLRIERQQIETFCYFMERFHQISSFTLFCKSTSCLEEGIINSTMFNGKSSIRFSTEKTG